MCPPAVELEMLVLPCTVAHIRKATDFIKASIGELGLDTRTASRLEMACEEDGSINENVWFVIKETTGVGDFIGSNGRPTSMPEHEVVQMLAASEKKVEGEEITAAPEEPRAQVIDLMEALKSSLVKGDQRKPARRAPRATAARTKTVAKKKTARKARK